MVIKLMDPKGWPDCPIPECENTKGEGYLMCPDHKNECPDGDCRVAGRKATDQEMCNKCCQYFQKKFKGKNKFYVYLLDNAYVGMTSNPHQRIQAHQEYRKRYYKSKRQIRNRSQARAVWWSPVFNNWKQALRCEWGLDYMLDKAIVDNQAYYKKRFKLITQIQASESAIRKAPTAQLP